MSAPGTWTAEPWTCHAATTVTVPDSTAVTGKRIVAECGTEADAILITAAPELLEALIAITNQLERIGDTRPHKDGQFIEDARAAIAKAVQL